MTVKQLRDLLAPYDEDHEIEMRSSHTGWSSFNIRVEELRFITVATATEETP